MYLSEKNEQKYNSDAAAASTEMKKRESHSLQNFYLYSLSLLLVEHGTLKLNQVKPLERNAKCKLASHVFPICFLSAF